MFIQQRNLRKYRKQSPLTQLDIGFIMQLTDNANYNISRWELSERPANIDMLIVYHLLFETPLETLCEWKKEELTATVTKRVNLLITELKKLLPDPKVESRIIFLTQALARLIA